VAHRRDEVVLDHLGAASIAEIGDNAEDQDSIARGHRIEADLDGELAAVLASPGDQAVLGCAWRGMPRELVAVPGVPGTQIFRHQDFDFLADELAMRIAEHLLQLVVDEQNPSRGLDQSDRERAHLGGAFEQIFRRHMRADVGGDAGSETLRAHVPLFAAAGRPPAASAAGSCV
jgi:hypothetical protein